MIKFIMMIGIPGSGKSTYAKKIAEFENAAIVSSDELRKELFGSVWELSKNAHLFGEIYRRIFKYLSEGKSVILDATNIRRNQRKHVLKKYKNYYKECYYIKTSLKKALERNNVRDRNVPEDVICSYFSKVQEPEYSEGWDKINIIYN